MNRRRKILYAIAGAGLLQYFAAMKLAARTYDPDELADVDEDEELADDAAIEVVSTYDRAVLEVLDLDEPAEVTVDVAEDK